MNTNVHQSQNAPENGITRRGFLGSSLALTFAMGAGASTLAGCSSSGGGSSASTLHFLSGDTDAPSLQWANAVNAAFKKKHAGVTIEAEAVNASDAFYTKIQAELASGAPPSFILRADDTVAATLYASNVILPANDLVDQIGKSRFTPSLLSHFVAANGDIYGVPHSASVMVFWYRTDLAHNAGLSPPKSWDDLLSFAKALTSAKDKKYGITLPYGLTTPTNALFLSFLRENGGNIVDPDLNVVFDSQATVETLEFYKELAQYSPPGSQNFGYPDLVNNFVNGTTASTYYIGKIPSAIVQTAPHLASKFSVAPRATPSGNGEQRPYVAVDAPVIIKGGSGLALAKDWIANFDFSPGWYAKWMNITPDEFIPTLSGVSSQPTYVNNPIRKRYPEILKFMADSLPQGVSFLKESPQHKINSEAGNLADGTLIASILQDVLVNNVSPKQAASDGAQKIRQLMQGARPI